MTRKFKQKTKKRMNLAGDVSFVEVASKRTFFFSAIIAMTRITRTVLISMVFPRMNSFVLLVSIFRISLFLRQLVEYDPRQLLHEAVVHLVDDKYNNSSNGIEHGQDFVIVLGNN